MTVDKLRKAFSGNKPLYKVLSKFYRGVYKPIVSGHLAYDIQYTIFLKHKEISKLNDMGFHDVSVFKPSTWRIGKGADKAYRRYYCATYNGKKCFIKIAKNDKTVQNEIVVQKAIQQSNFTFTPQCLMTCINFYPDTAMLANEYIEGLCAIPEDATPDQLVDYTKQFLKILQQMESVGLVHADIHRGNLMLSQKNELILMDFGISHFINKENNVNYVERPGTFYRREGKYRIYDDAYSYLKLLEKINVYSVDCPEFGEIESRVGKLSVKIFTDGK